MKVTIRKTRKTDKETLDRFWADEEVSKQLLLPSNAESWVPQFRKSLKKAYGFTIMADENIVGEIALEGPSRCRSTYSVGFAVGREFWDQGICTEALKQIVRFGFDELKIHKICGDNDSDNPASGRVLEKTGFKKEGVFKEHVFKEGKYIDIIHWGLINATSAEHNPER